MAVSAGSKEMHVRTNESFECIHVSGSNLGDCTHKSQTVRAKTVVSRLMEQSGFMKNS